MASHTYRVEFTSSLEHCNFQYHDGYHVMSGLAFTQGCFLGKSGLGGTDQPFGVYLQHGQFGRLTQDAHSRVGVVGYSTGTGGLEMPLTFGTWQIVAEFSTADEDCGGGTFSVAITDPNGSHHTLSGTFSLLTGWGAVGPYALAEMQFLARHNESDTAPDDLLYGMQLEHTVDRVAFYVDGVLDTEEEFSDESFDPPWEYEEQWESAGHSTWSCADGLLTVHTQAFYPYPDYSGNTAGAYLFLRSVYSPHLPSGGISLCYTPPARISAVRAPGPLTSTEQAVEHTDLDGAWNRQTRYPTWVRYPDADTAIAQRWNSPCLDRLGADLLCGACGLGGDTGPAGVGLLTGNSLRLYGMIEQATANPWAQIEVVATRPNGRVLALLLEAPPGGPYVWYQATGQWSRDMDALTFCTPVLANGLPEAFTDGRGSLRRFGSGYLFGCTFPAEEEAPTAASLYHCPGVDENGAGIWTQVGGIFHGGGTWKHLEIECLRPQGAVAALLLNTGEDPPRWYQTLGLPNHDGDTWTFPTRVHVPEFADASAHRGGLRQLPDGSLLFAFVDAVNATRFYRTDRDIGTSADGTWTEVGV